MSEPETIDHILANPSGDSDLVGEFDARVWAKRFVRRAAEQPGVVFDEETMQAWFAVAIMAGYDEHARRYPNEISKENQP